MVDKPELLYLSQQKSSLTIRTEGNRNLISRGRKDASALLLRREEQPCLALVRLDGKWGMLGRDGKFLVEPSYGSVQRFWSGLAAFSYSPLAEHSLFGYLDVNGRVAIPPQFEGAEGFHDGLARVKFKGKFGFITRDGKFAVKPQYDSASSRFREGTAVVELAKKRRFVDCSGNFVAGEFDELWDSGAFVLEARVGTKWGFVNRRGEFLIEPKYEYVRDLDGGGWAVSENGIRTFVDGQGRVGSNIMEGAVARFPGGMIQVRFGTNSSFVDRSGNVLFRWDNQKKHVSRFHDGVCLVRYFGDGRNVSPWTSENSALTDRADYVDETGKQLNDDGFTATCNFSEGRGIVARENRYGYIDRDGKLLTPVMFLEANPFAGGYAQVRTESGVLSWIDAKGASVTEPKFSEEGTVRMRIKPFDEPWSWASPPSFYNDTRFTEGLCRVKLSGKWGFVDTQCRIVVKPEFFKAANFSCGLAAVAGCDGKWGFIDKSGRVAIPMDFEFARGFYRAEPEFSEPFSEWEEWLPGKPKRMSHP
jgi:hypothetical protein